MTKWDKTRKSDEALMTHMIEANTTCVPEYLTSIYFTGLFFFKCIINVSLQILLFFIERYMNISAFVLYKLVTFFTTL